MRLAAKIDDNQAEIVKALRAAGCLVLSLAAVGRGCPDLLVCKADKLVLLEVKDGNKSPSRQALTPDQVRFHSVWPVAIVTTPEAALVHLGIIKP